MNGLPWSLASGAAGRQAVYTRPADHGVDVLSMLSTNMTQQEILEDFPELEPEDILAALAFAAGRKYKVYSLAVQ